MQNFPEPTASEERQRDNVDQGEMAEGRLNRVIDAVAIDRSIDV